MDELINQFSIEARELVQQATDDLLSLEANPHRRDSLESAFRAIHTLKGSVGLFDFGPMLSVLHRAEDLLSEVRAERTVVDAALLEKLLAVVQWVEDSIPGIEQTGQLSDAQETQAPRLIRILHGEQNDRLDNDINAAPGEIPAWARSLERELSPGTAGSLIAIRYEPHPECFFNGDDPLATVLLVPDLREVRVSLKEPRPSKQEYEPFRCQLVIEVVSGSTRSEVEAVFQLIPDQVEFCILPQVGSSPVASASDAPSDRSARGHATAMRVDSARIDKLVEIAGELIVAKNSLAPLAGEARDHGHEPLARRIVSSHDEIDRLVAALYNAVTQARMIPLEHTFRRFPRLMRETASRLGKSLDLIIDGETIEADREIVDNLYEPLLHILRNCLDHGIEPETERLQASKPAKGRLYLRARQSGDRIEIEIADDGRGIDPQHIRSIAKRRGMISGPAAEASSDQDILQLVFAPGFTTALSVSDLSGRGVGLDAVRHAVGKLGGSIDLRSALGSGTSFTLKLPISFSMTQLMMVEVGGERYGIPLSHVVETLKLPHRAIQPVRAGQAFLLRNQIVPLVYLAGMLDLPAPEECSGDIKVLIVQAGEERVGIAVDEIAERAETLTRPVSALLQSVPGIAGTALSGNGSVVLVLNVEELV